MNFGGYGASDIGIGLFTGHMSIQYFWRVGAPFFLGLLRSHGQQCDKPNSTHLFPNSLGPFCFAFIVKKPIALLE